MFTSLKFPCSFCIFSGSTEDWRSLAGSDISDQFKLKIEDRWLIGQLLALRMVEDRRRVSPISDHQMVADCGRTISEKCDVCRSLVVCAFSAFTWLTIAGCPHSKISYPPELLRSLADCLLAIRMWNLLAVLHWSQDDKTRLDCNESV